MDKYEYKVRLDEIYSLISEGEFVKAVEIADSIDWRRVKSIKTLCTVSDLYKINRRYQESKEILLMAYERYPNGRLIVYSLCELSIKLEEYVQAIEYYKEYVQLAPKDSNRYILQYRLYEAQDVTLEERIAVLEEFKSKDYREKWAYELAYLYHRVGLSSKCVDECDELIVTFGSGKYVVKAMELKALHEPLSQTQQLKYETWMSEKGAVIATQKADEEIPAKVVESTSDVNGSTDEEDLKGAPTTEMPQEVDIQVKTVDVGQYNTINLQEALAESMKDLWGEEEEEAPAPIAEPSAPQADVEDNTIFGTGPLAGTAFADETLSGDVPVVLRPAKEEPAPEEIVEKAPQEEVREEIQTPVASPEIVQVQAPEAPSSSMLDEATKRIPTDAVVDYLEAQRLKAEIENSTASLQASDAQAEKIPGAVTGKLDSEAISSEYDQMLVQGYDGQISLALSEAEEVEKQITGQLSIDDILASWEETKKENEKKREDEVKQRILQHTGSLFDEFDEDTKAALLAQLEKAFMDAIVKESKAGKAGAEELGKKIRREAMRVVEDLSKEQIERSNEASNGVLPTAVTEEVAEEAVPAPASVKEITVEPEEEVVAAEELVPQDNTEDAAPEIAEEQNEEVNTDDNTEEEPEEESAEVEAVRQALEDDEEEDKSKPVESKTYDAPVDEDGNRVLSDEEEEAFAAYLTRRSTRKQIIYALDNMSMAAYTGNCIITGEEGVGTLDLGRLLLVQMKSMDPNFVAQKVANIAGKKLNGKNIPEVFEKINGGALVIEHARGMKKSTVEAIMKALENENLGIIVILEDTAEGIDRILSAIPKLADFFNVRIDLKALDDKALVNYACEYAVSQEYSIDEFAVLALHTRIEEMQTSDHQVTIAEVRELVDDAIYYADKKSIGHFFDILLHKRYDDDDMIILREKDFMHY